MGELQREPLARSGGYAMIGSFILAVAVSLVFIPRDSDESTRILGLIAGVLVVLPIALVDDVKRLGALPQLVGQIALAAIAMRFGVVITSIASPFGGLIALPIYLALPFTVVWIVGMINTVNVIDTMDGLAAGVAAIAALVLFARSISLGQVTVSILPIALVGVCVGFLRFNFNPARIIMGTSGSMFLGYALATLSLIGGAKIATAAFVLGLPIIDFAMVIVQRAARRRSPMAGGDDAHLTHRLVRRGLSTRRIALSIYAVCATGGAMAMALNGVQKLLVIAVVGVVAVVIALRLASDQPEVAPNSPAHDIT
jgi:UDP-GlcNAc:undecaprenyl-phosphate/decaprenyl-phosphate GlcNAc-1-phosphate transferase